MKSNNLNNAQSAKQKQNKGTLQSLNDMEMREQDYFNNIEQLKYKAQTKAIKSK